jgi:hypothetical protein
MTSMLTNSLQNRRAAFERGLGLLLTVFILYGATVEAGHRHGRILSSDNGSASLVESGQTETPVGSKTGCSDCLICQLHQNFTTTLIAFRLVDSPTQIRLQITTAIPPDVLSQIAGPTSGRAPPFIS